MFKTADMFKTKSPQQKNEEVIRAAETLKDLDNLSQLAKNLLADERYRKYRKLMEEMLGKAVKEMFSFSHPDNNVYSTNMRVIITRLQTLISFLNAPINFLNYVETNRIDVPKKEKE